MFAYTGHWLVCAQCPLPPPPLISRAQPKRIRARCCGARSACNLSNTPGRHKCAQRPMPGPELCARLVDQFAALRDRFADKYARTRDFKHKPPQPQPLYTTADHLAAGIPNGFSHSPVRTVRTVANSFGSVHHRRRPRARQRREIRRTNARAHRELQQDWAFFVLSRGARALTLCVRMHAHVLIFKDSGCSSGSSSGGGGTSCGPSVD